MLKVDLTVVPFGDYRDQYNIETIYIGNVGGNKDYADYHVWFNNGPSNSTNLEDRPEPNMVLKKFKRSKGALELLRIILSKLQSEGYNNDGLKSMKGLNARN